MKLRIVRESGKFWIQQYRWWAWRDVERVPDEVHDCFTISHHTKKYDSLQPCIAAYTDIRLAAKQKGIKVICES